MSDIMRKKFYDHSHEMVNITQDNNFNLISEIYNYFTDEVEKAAPF